MVRNCPRRTENVYVKVTSDFDATGYKKTTSRKAADGLAYLFGISKDDPEPIDPERLASSVLGLNVKMLPLCSDGSILGLTVFQKCGFTVTLGDGTKLAEVFMPKDVVIDSALAADSCTGCRNFTIAHEAAHHILADLFPNDYMDDDEDYGYDPEFEDDDADSSVNEDDNEPV